MSLPASPPRFTSASPRRSWIRSAAGALLVLALSGAAAFGQPCFGPDNLAGGCCQQVFPTLPAFPGVQLPGLGICWKNCQVGQQNSLRVDWLPPVPSGCTQYTTTLNVTDANNNLPIMSGTLVLDYTRTWDEIDPNGQFHQVWRFAAKADLSPALVGIVPPCPSPSCLAPFGSQPTAFFYGYVDYVEVCGGGGIVENAVVLYHACDFFIHRPGLSDRPGSFHPNESYAIVAPVSSAQPFAILNSPSSSGPLIGDGIRTNLAVVPPLCLSTNFISSGQMNLLGGACLCPPTAAPKQQQFRTISATLNCPDFTGVQGNFQALNLGFPTLLPWFNLTTTNIGMWTNNNVYPGKEAAWVDEGLFIHNDSCTGTFVSTQYGGSTRFGWSILHPVLLSGLTDLADNYTAPIGGPYSFPIFGSVYPTDRVTFVFTP